MGEIIDPEQLLWRKHMPLMPEDIEIPPLSIWEFAELSGISEKKLIKEIKKGRIRADCTNGTYSVSHDEVCRYLSRHHNKAWILIAAIGCSIMVTIWAIVIRLI